ncbi:ATP-dependent RNA helicase HrpA [Thiohalomonas denitrificans]|uniref:ATP-dependent RNA helicase HrpA n=1 Tax=Thiohalomonas denitrificans TaxID=415747 RepID=UPI003983B022
MDSSRPGVPEVLETLETLFHDIHACMLADRGRFRRRLEGLKRRHSQGKPMDRGLEALRRDVATSRARRQRRAETMPSPDYPGELPISDRRAEIAEAIGNHPVVVIAGETGSGKTTQIPKICLELGRGVDGLIGHTQPRRIAARSVAARIAEELHTEIGRSVGYKVRFTDRSGPDSHIRLMTDGILLAEIQSDPLLEHYDTLIIDEAHERSLNIDFLLGYLKRLLPRRPDLKLIITSATINTEAFSRFFGGAPVVEVSGRTYPVEVRYRPVAGDDPDDRDRDQPQAICEAVDELARENPLGDILIFLPGEREIRETAEALRKHRSRNPVPTEILPLFSRLSAGEQDRIFRSHAGRRIVLATNVAETSLTVPGIRFVIDTGYARISRYSYRTKVQRLPIESIAQASANQRAGRCGRVANGICIRLYSEEDFLGRPEFSDPEVRRTNLASVILQMANLKLGDVGEFPFLEPPDRRFITDGYRLLHELHAVDERNCLTEIGRKLVRLPVDPRIGRMLIAADTEGSLKEVLVIASALSIQDPRERPMEAQQQADECHRRFMDEESDFIAFLSVWDYYHEHARHLSNSKLRKLCRAEFLSYLRMREWHDIHGQLVALVRELGLTPNQESAEYGAIHRALLSGLMSHAALKIEAGEDKRQRESRKRRRPLVGYQGARNIRLAIFPGSGVAKKPPRWIMAAELVETSHLFGRLVARIDPRWLESLGKHLIKRSYSEPHWEQRPAQVGAFEQVTLYGLIIVARRRINYGPIDPALSREIFIRRALVHGDYRTSAAFFSHNRRLVEELESQEAKSRRRDILVDEQVLFEFYDTRIPENIYSGHGFDQWRKQTEREKPKWLFLTREELIREDSEGVDAVQFPDHLGIGGAELPLGYHFEPGHPADGVTVVVPVELLGQLKPARFEWLVPGLREEKLIALIKSLPKSLRRNFVPAVNFARAALEALRADDAPLTEVFARQLLRMTGIEVPADAWQLDALPQHLLMNFRVTDEKGKTLQEGRDLVRLQQAMAGQVRQTLSEKPLAGIERKGITAWDFGELPETVETQSGGLTLRAWPALVDCDESVAIRLFESKAAAKGKNRAGLRRLFTLEARDKVKYLRRSLPDRQTLCLLFAHRGGCDPLCDDIIAAAIDRVLFAKDEAPRNASEFEARLAEGRRTLVPVAAEIASYVKAALEQERLVRKALKGPLDPQAIQTAADVNVQIERLVYPGFVSATPSEWLPRLPAYLKAALSRLEKLPRSPARDRQAAQELAPLVERLETRWAAIPEGESPESELQRFRWLLEEFRVSLFAQELGTVERVSATRLQRQWKESVA